jgi:hypothetical protein
MAASIKPIIDLLILSSSLIRLPSAAMAPFAAPGRRIPHRENQNRTCPHADPMAAWPLVRLRVFGER